MKAKVHAFFIGSLFVLFLGLTLVFVFNPYRGIQVKAIAINPNSDRSIISRIYLPQNPPYPLPVIILCHGVNNSKEMMTPLALELARNGLATIPFDFGGYGESYQLSGEGKSIDNLGKSTLEDAEAILNFIRQNPERFDVNKIGIIGHSLGGAAALELAKKEPELKTTGVLSITGDATPTKPKNLFLGVGIYEQLNPPPQLRSTLQQATEKPAKCLNEAICGNFKSGTARQLFISSTSDHVTAPYNPLLMTQVIKWVQYSFNLPNTQETLQVPGFIIGQILSFTSAIAISMSLFLKIPPSKQRFGSMGIGTSILGIWAIERTQIISPNLASNGILFSFVLLLLCNYALRHPNHFFNKIQVAALYSLLVFSAFAIPTLLGGVPEILAKPAYLIALPQFIMQWGFFILYNYAQVVKVAFFPTYTFDLTLSGFGWLLLTVELIFPGVTLTAIAHGLVRTVHWLRRPFRLGINQVSRQEVAVLAGLLLVLTGVLYQRATDKLLFVAFDMGLFVLKLFGLLVLLPIVIVVLGVRSQLFRRIESSLLKP